MVLETIVKRLSLKPLYENMKIDIEVNGVIVSDILSDVMAKSQKGDLWITSQTHVNVIAIIFFKGLSGAILPGGRQLENDASEKAIEREYLFLCRVKLPLILPVSSMVWVSGDKKNEKNFTF